MTKICDNCLKTPIDKVEWIAKAAKGGAKHPAENYICSKCVQKLLRVTHNAPDEKLTK